MIAPFSKLFGAFFWGIDDGKECTCNVGDLSSIPGSGRSPRKGNGNPLVFLPGEFHGQRSLVGLQRVEYD